MILTHIGTSWSDFGLGLAGDERHAWGKTTKIYHGDDDNGSDYEADYNDSIHYVDDVAWGC